jgi:hypothetical protein
MKPEDYARAAELLDIAEAETRTREKLEITGAGSIAAAIAKITRGPEAEEKFKDGSVVLLNGRGIPYVLANTHDTPHGRQATIRRQFPKIKGKAAKKAARKERREERRRML